MMFLAAVPGFEGMGNAYSAWKLFFTILEVGAGILVTWALVMIVVMTVMYLFLTYWEH
jgi:hypothetical protein